MSKPRYQLLIEKGGNAGIKHLNDLKVFMEYSNTIDDVYSNIDEYNLKINRKCLFNKMIPDINTNKKKSSHCQRIIYNMQKIEYISSIYHTILFRCSKKNVISLFQIKLCSLSINEDS